jgi:ESCRT-II complex subunit VPS36
MINCSKILAVYFSPAFYDYFRTSNNMGEWSPFYCLPKATLTAAGLLQLDTTDNEVELLRRPQIELRHDGTEPIGPCPRNAQGYWKSRTSNLLTLTITTHRLAFTDPTSDTNDTRFIHLSNVHVIQGAGGPSFQHPRATYKIIVSTFTYGDFVLVFQIRDKDNRDAALSQLEKALGRKQWELATRMQEKKAKQSQAEPKRVGVDHILTKHKLRHEQASKLADDALSGDAELLLEQAGELLQVIQKYTVLLQKYNKQETSGSDDDADAAHKLAGLLSDMGMTSALTKSQVAGGKSHSFGGGGGGGRASSLSSSSSSPALRDYYELTARQIADFLLPRLSNDKAGGIMSLTDVYCLFNRARGTNLISPEDLREACALLGDLNVGLSQRIFPSGVIVIQLDQFALSSNNRNSDSKMAKTLINLCPTTALEASHALKLSPLLALEQLEEAERLGLLCRDVTLETVRFFYNKFNEW